MINIVAFGHRQRVGKDTATNFALGLLRPARVSCQRCSFGDSIKEQAFQMFGWTGLREGVYYENHPEEKDVILPTIGKSPRQIWIELGMKAREISVKVWPELAFSKASEDVLIIPDLRHPVEIEYIRMYPSLCIRIDRQAAPKKDDGIDNALEGYDKWDYVIENNGSLREFRDQICAILKERVLTVKRV